MSKWNDHLPTDYANKLMRAEIERLTAEAPQLSAVDLDVIKDHAHDEFIKRPTFHDVDIQVWCILKATQVLLISKGQVVPFTLPEWEQEDSLPVDDSGLGIIEDEASGK